MNAMLKKDIATEKKIRGEYKAAKAVGDCNAMEAARQAIMAHERKIHDQGVQYRRIFDMVLDADERGNEYIDISECLFDKDVAPLMEAFRNAGIETFTFSSTWSGSVEIAWKFTLHGYHLGGMTEINGSTRKIFSEEYEKVHAFIFNK